MFDFKSQPLIRQLIIASVVAIVVHGGRPATEASGKYGVSEELSDYLINLDNFNPRLKSEPQLEEIHDLNDNEDDYFPITKRNPYSFGLGKRNGLDVDPEDPSFYPAMRFEKKDNPRYAFGLGKRDPYDFGLGKRNPYSFGLGKKNQYVFGLGKRNMYEFGLGKKRDPYAFGLGKRDPYNFGLGK